MLNLYEYELIPLTLMNGLERYIHEHIETGSFLRACLENNAHHAAVYGTAMSLAHFPAIMRFIYNECPTACWGSEEKVTAWIASGLRKL